MWATWVILQGQVAVLPGAAQTTEAFGNPCLYGVLSEHCKITGRKGTREDLRSSKQEMTLLGHCRTQIRENTVLFSWPFLCESSLVNFVLN